MPLCKIAYNFLATMKRSRLDHSRQVRLECSEKEAFCKGSLSFSFSASHFPTLSLLFPVQVGVPKLQNHFLTNLKWSPVMQRVRGFICPGLEISISERAASTAIQQRICGFNCCSNGTEQILHLRLSELFPTIVFSNSIPKGSVRVLGRRSNSGCFGLGLVINEVYLLIG